LQQQFNQCGSFSWQQPSQSQQVLQLLPQLPELHELHELVAEQLASAVVLQLGAAALLQLPLSEIETAAAFAGTRSDTAAVALGAVVPDCDAL
jgi:hypothetical protein